jgi:nucleotide-binding universal stress UspA family protein
LVPVDFSDPSTAAAEHAVMLSGCFDAEVILLHVVHRAPSDASRLALASEAETPAMRLETEARTEMESLVATVSSGRPIETLLVAGDVIELVERVVRERSVDLVVVPTHGYGPFRRFLLGSVTAKILHDVSCPIFTGTHVPEVPEYTARPYRKVACAIDLKEGSERVLGWAWDFARAWQAELSVIHSVPAPDVNLAYGEFMVRTAGPELAVATSAIEKLLASAGCKAHVVVDSGDVTRTVCRAADQWRANVVVIGRSPARGLMGRLRTHTYSLIREAPCPVISV